MILDITLVHTPSKPINSPLFFSKLVFDVIPIKKAVFDVIPIKKAVTRKINCS